MLLDRRRIRKWAKWIALFLAIVFVLSFLLLGVGYGGGAGFNLFDLFGKKSSTNTTLSPDDKIAALLATLQQNPSDLTTLLALATAYQQREDWSNAAKYLGMALDVNPSQKDLYLRLATIYLNKLSNYAAAVAVLNKAVSVDPNNPDLYLQLGIAQRDLGNASAAIMAWQRYLALDPNGEQAAVIRDQVAKLSAQATTTTSSATTSTTTSGTSSTAAGLSPSTAAPTTTTAAP